MGGLRGYVVPLSTDEMRQEAGEGLQMLLGLHGRYAGFLPSEQKQKALLVAGAQSHPFQLRSEAVSPREDSANEEGPCHSCSD